MSDPWADVRERVRHWREMPEILSEHEKDTIVLLDDADALLAVVRANFAFFPGAKDEWEFAGTEIPQEWWDLQNALAALPEYLK